MKKMLIRLESWEERQNLMEGIIRQFTKPKLLPKQIISHKIFKWASRKMWKELKKAMGNLSGGLLNQ